MTGDGSMAQASAGGGSDLDGVQHKVEARESEHRGDADCEQASEVAASHGTNVVLCAADCVIMHRNVHDCSYLARKTSVCYIHQLFRLGMYILDRHAAFASGFTM
jgi:hypothetical protein